MVESATSRRVGVLLVGGFLGAGKTTLLRRLVADPQIGARIAILVNELGTLGLDEALVRDASESATLRTVQLDSGCLCCTLRGELGDALHALARPEQGTPPDQIIVELSGAALASEVHFQIATQALDAPYYADGLVCLVDATHAARWAREAEALFRDQLSRADLVLLTKIDLASVAERAAADALIAEVAPGARVVACTRGEIDPALLLGMIATRPSPTAGHGHAHALVGETIECGPLRADGLQHIVDELGAVLYRIKGLVDLRDGDTVRTVYVQCVGEQLELTPARAMDDEPRRLTFIGPDVDRLRCEALMEKARG